MFAWASEDISCMFYVFSIPRAWRPWMAFNHNVQSSGRNRTRLCATVLGMGWLSSVGVAQHLIRQLALLVPTWGAGLPPDQELRRDADFPGWLVDRLREFWLVYLDNFDCCAVGERRKIVELLSSIHRWQQCIRVAYDSWGVPQNAEKSLPMSFVADSLGVALDGDEGVGLGLEKACLDLFSFTCFVLSKKVVVKLLIEMLSGRLVHRMQTRRPTMGGLARIWKYLRRWGWGRPVPAEVEEDVIVSLLLFPLMFFDFRAPVDHRVTCADASPHGNGL